MPSAEELDHDYLWRYARQLPARGDIGIFNRSHYEEVLVVRVHPEVLDRQKLPPEAKARGHLGAPLPGDQRLGALPRRQRVQGREALPEPVQGGATDPVPQADRPAGEELEVLAADVRERARWDDYQVAFSEMLSATSTEWAPWYVIPADRKWFARICVAAVLAHTLIDIDPQYPAVSRRPARNCWRSGSELEAEAPKGAAGRSVEAAATRHGSAEARQDGAGRTHDGRRQDHDGPEREIGGEHGGDSQRHRRARRQRRLVRALAADVARGARRRPGRRADRGRAAELLAQNGPNALPEEKPKPGWLRFLDAVPQLHADHPGRRRGGVAADRGVEHRDPPARR